MSKMWASNKTIRDIVKYRGKWGTECSLPGLCLINSQIPDVKNFNEDILLPVGVNTKYGERVPIQISSHPIK